MRCQAGRQDAAGYGRQRCPPLRRVASAAAFVAAGFPAGRSARLPSRVFVGYAQGHGPSCGSRPGGRMPPATAGKDARRYGGPSRCMGASDRGHPIWGYQDGKPATCSNSLWSRNRSSLFPFLQKGGKGNRHGRRAVLADALLEINRAGFGWGRSSGPENLSAIGRLKRAVSYGPKFLDEPPRADLCHCHV